MRYVLMSVLGLMLVAACTPASDSSNNSAASGKKFDAEAHRRSIEK